MPDNNESEYTIGQEVQCRDIGENWRNGKVESLNPLKVKAEGWEQSFEWEEVRKLEQKAGSSVISKNSNKYNIASVVEILQENEWIEGKVIQAEDDGRVSVLGLDNKIMELEAESEMIRLKMENLNLSNEKSTLKTQKSTEIENNETTMSNVHASTIVSINLGSSPDMFSDILDPLAQLRDFQKKKLSPRKILSDEVSEEFHASEPPTSPKSPPQEAVKVETQSIETKAKSPTSEKAIPVVHIPLSSSSRANRPPVRKDSYQKRYRKKNTKTKKSFMQATKSSRNRFCEKEDAVVIVNFVRKGKKVGRIGVCEGDNAYQVAADFLKKRRDIPSSKRDQLADLLIAHLDHFTR